MFQTELQKNISLMTGKVELNVVKEIINSIELIEEEKNEKGEKFEQSIEIEDIIEDSWNDNNDSFSNISKDRNFFLIGVGMKGKISKKNILQIMKRNF